MDSPLISVITVSFNAERYIEQTIQSVLAQTWCPVEYIIVDGGSTDGTQSIIREYRGHCAHVIMEKDDGIADAMNKGLALAKGDYVIFLHADDYFINDHCLRDAIAFLDEKTDILACRIQFGKRQKVFKPRGFNFWMYLKTGVYHQGALCRRSLLNRLEGFDKQFRIVMDYDFFLRAYRHGARLVKAPLILTAMRDEGISTRQDWESMKSRFEEERRVHTKNTRSLFSRLLYKAYWYCYPAYRQWVYTIKNGRRFFSFWE